MSRARRQKGSISMAALAVLVLMASVAAGGALVLQAALSYGRRSSEKEAGRVELEREVERVVRALAADQTPEADSLQDPVWDAVGAPQAAGVQVGLEDVSSRLNPNWVQKAAFEKTRLGDILLAGSVAAELQQRREDEGFSLDIASRYEDLIREEALPEYFSAYGYANINVTDEFALRKLYVMRTGNEAGSEAFHDRIQRLLMEKKVLKPAELRDFLGVDYEALYPVVNAEPIMNVHFVPPVILAQLLAYPDWGVPHPEQTAQLLEGRRDGSELTPQELHTIIGTAENNRIYQYLGTVTWFWRIVASRGTACLESIVARLPSEADDAPRFLIVEERYSS
jgi:hypothetical protein